MDLKVEIYSGRIDSFCLPFVRENWNLFIGKSSISREKKLIFVPSIKPTKQLPPIKNRLDTKWPNQIKNLWYMYQRSNFQTLNSKKGKSISAWLHGNFRCSPQSKQSTKIFHSNEQICRHNFIVPQLYT